MKQYVVLACLLFACASDDDPELGSTTQDVVSTNGRSLNGVSLNGRSLNGRSLNGISLNGVSLNGRSLNGVSLSGSQLAATGTTLVGATLSGQLDNGTTVALRIDSASTLAAPNTDVWAYGVSYAVGDGTWAPLCGANTLAIPLAGTWNYGAGVVGGGSWSASTTNFTFGCRGTALAKCVELGYKPWKTVNGVSLRDQHQACTRMLRADYCGDGTSYTFNGWSLNVFDNLGIQTLAPGYSDWSFEAHWGASGASCMSSYRALDLIVSTDLPACVVARTTDSCTDNGFGDGSLLQDYYDPWSLEVALASAYDSYPSAKVPLQLAMTNISQAMTFMSKTPADVRNAALNVQLAVTNLKLAITKGLPSAFANDLMRRYALLIRGILVNSIAAAKPGSVAMSLAQQNLASGDVLFAKPDYPSAVDKFKLGIWNL